MERNVLHDTTITLDCSAPTKSLFPAMNLGRAKSRSKNMRLEGKDSGRGCSARVNNLMEDCMYESRINK